MFSKIDRWHLSEKIKTSFSFVIDLNFVFVYRLLPKPVISNEYTCGRAVSKHVVAFFIPVFYKHVESEGVNCEMKIMLKE